MSSPGISIHMQEWERLSPAQPKGCLAGVYLEKDASAIAQKLSSSGKLEITELRAGLFIRATSCVGRITLGNVQITIQPKISGAPLVRLLRYAYKLRNLDLLTAATYSTETLSFQELLILQLIAEISELQARGLLRKYVRTDHNLASPRGKILVQQITRQGGIVQQTLPCAYYPRLEDCLINQVLLQGLHLAATLTNESAFRVQLYKLIASFQDTVSTIRLDNHVFQRLQHEMNRLTAAYEPAITIIEMLFNAQGISLSDDQGKLELDGFLFDMNLFFQALLSRFLKENLQQYEVRDQYKIKHMMTYAAAENPRHRKAPALQPDYIIKRQAAVISILDAKYRDLWEKDLPPHMLYQLAMYALSQPVPIETAILYPTVDPQAQQARIVIRDPVTGSQQAYIVLRPVNLLLLSDLVAKAEVESASRERTAFAAWLAFGKASYA